VRSGRRPILAAVLAASALAAGPGAAGCRAAGDPPSSFPLPGAAAAGAGERVRVTLEEGELVVELPPTAVDPLGLFLEDGAGRRVAPRVALDEVAAPVDLGVPDGRPVSTALFPLEGLGAHPWTLCLLRRAAPAWRVLLAEIERVPAPGPAAALGYERETWSFPDGESRVVYSRRAGDGGRVEIPRGDFEGELLASIERLADALPATMATAVAPCPAIAELVAAGLEAGARYMGPAEGDNLHRHARGERFWSRPRLAPGADGALVEDPVDSLVWLLVELFNASSADAYRRIWQGVLDGTLSEDDYLARETLLKAVQLRRAVRAIQAGAGCLQLDEWRGRGALVFREYERWVESSGGDPRRLARMILGNPARYTLSPAEVGLTYGERLRGLYRANAPIAAGG